MRISFAFLAFGFLTTLIVGGVFIASSLHDLKNLQKENAIDSISYIAHDKEEILQGFFDLQKEKLNKISEDEMFLDFVDKYYSGENILPEDKKDILTFFEFFDVDAVVIDDSGRIITSSRENSNSSRDIFWKTYKIEDNNEFNFYIYYDDIIQKDFLVASKYFDVEDPHKPRPLGREILDHPEVPNKPRTLVRGETQELLDIQNHSANLVFEISLDELERIMSVQSKERYFGDDKRAYIVNSDYSLATPIKFLDRKLTDNLLVQQIDTENSRKCFEHLSKSNSKELKRHDTDMEGVVYTDFRGEEVFGTHLPVPEANLCIIVEMDKSKIYDSSYLNKFLYMLLGLIILVSFLSYLIGDLLREIYLKKLGNKEKSKKLSGMTLPLQVYIVFGAVFLFTFVFLFATFFGLFGEMNIFDNFPDLAFLILSFVLFRISFGLKNSLAEKFISFGAICLILYKMLEISFGTYQFTREVLHWGFWASSYSFYVVGTLLLLRGFWEMFK